MPKIQQPQPLTNWKGDVPSLLIEMKRRAGVGTDRDLAAALGVAQSTVAHWRARGSIPEAALLRAELKLSAGQDPVASRAMAARILAIRVAEFWYQAATEKGAKGGRDIFYSSTAMMLHSLMDEAYHQLAIIERETGMDPMELAGRLIEDRTFLTSLMEFAKGLSFVEGLSREALSPPVIRVRPAK